MRASCVQLSNHPHMSEYTPEQLDAIRNVNKAREEAIEAYGKHKQRYWHLRRAWYAANAANQYARELGLACVELPSDAVISGAGQLAQKVLDDVHAQCKHMSELVGVPGIGGGIEKVVPLAWSDTECNDLSAVPT